MAASAADRPRPRSTRWRRFEFTFTATTQDTHTILSRATDSGGAVQPVVPAWNPSGYLWNAPDTVRLEVKA